MQHADHFMRILNERESVRKEKLLENRSQSGTSILDEHNKTSEQISDKDLTENSSEDTEIKKSEKSQVEII